ncbi:hypothetical protein CKM354_000744400 [Cercospora kikuchii]|uniref:Gpi anchored cell wall protein n=1 Tax=Cercospora kikuchii TaxID=84275 RepID=A0A9P3CPH0_9PEZI|nr:uncharacterized protein CKM354_000744400 [Cercospora kikuchii]GIZ44240.1 hypothetical protein CKM354_000744400 [Cercospora kikuchii]
MFVKSTAVLALLSVAAQVAIAAQPPACVIAAVNTESDPSDFKTICSSEKALSYLSDNCGDNLKTAQDYFADICKTNGEEVTFPDKDDDDKDSTSTESSSPTATRSGSGSSASETGGSGSSTTYGSNANNPSATNSGSTAESTGAASSVRLGMDVLGMSALLAFGAMLAI